MIGTYPTPVHALPALSTAKCELWVKRDDQTGEAYGGNKVRKLEHILEAARKKGATRVVTVGAVGSNHVLATTIYGRRAGFRVAAILTPQPRTEHVVNNIRAGLALGLEVLPVSGLLTLPNAVKAIRQKGDYFVGPGGSSVLGSTGYVDAVRELLDQIAQGAAPAPDALVVALGSAGTAAGLLAGVVGLKLPAKVVGVRVVSPVLMGKWRAIALASRVARRVSLDAPRGALSQAFELAGGYLGKGYGHATEAGERALAIGREHDLSLDPTYTAKTFAAALDLVESGRYRRVLYWHTLSSVSLAGILATAPALDDIVPEIRRLLVAGPRKSG